MRLSPSTDKELLKHAQDGGIVSTLFAYALDEGIIDGAIVAASKEFAAKNPSKVMLDNSNWDMIEPWRPIPIVNTKAELLAAAVLKYNISPNVSLLKEATRKLRPGQDWYRRHPVPDAGSPQGTATLIGMRDARAYRARSRYLLHGELPYQSILRRPRSHEDGIRQEDGDRQGQFWVYGKRGQVVRCPSR